MAGSLANRTLGNLLIQTARQLRYLTSTMDELDPPTKNDEPTPSAADLARRLARYRRRVEAEGRQRTLRVIDRVIEDVEDHAGEAG